MGCGAPGPWPVRGLSLCVHRWGTAGRPPALLLHSLAAHGHWWDWVAPRLAGRFDVAALDFRGHGASAWAEPAAYHFDDYVADVAALLDALGWARPLLVGHSMGGYVAALFAARHPARAGAVVIADVLTGWTDALADFVRRKAAEPVAAFASLEAAVARFRLSPPGGPAPAERVRHLAETGVVRRGSGWQHAFDPRVFGHPRPEPWPFLPQVRCPALVVRGEHSTVMDAGAARAVARTVAQGRVVEIAGAHHHLPVDDPEAFARAVLDWHAELA